MTIYTDAFTGTNNTNLETYSASWVSVDGGAGTWQIYNNQARAILAEDLSAYYYNQTFANAHYAQVKLAGATGAGNGSGPAIRVSAGPDYYYCFPFAGGKVYNGQVVNGSATDWDSGLTMPAAGSVIRLEIDTTTPTTVYYKDDGVTVATYTNRLTLTSGRAGLAAYGDPVNVDLRVDDWEAGDNRRFYLTPLEAIIVGATRYCGPLYFAWRSPACSGTGTLPRIESADYGFADIFLVAADLTDPQRADLATHADAYEFPANLDTVVNKTAITPFFEGVHLPTDWLTASNTNRELLRQLWSMFGFANHYFVLSSGHSLWSAVTLDTRYRNIPAQEKVWFDATVTALGGNPADIGPNQTIRQLLKIVSDYIKTPFTFGGVSI